MKISRHIYAVAGILVILTAASFGTGGKVQTTKPSVTVVNPTSNPVNTRAVGTTAVSGAVTIANASPIAVQFEDNREPFTFAEQIILDSDTGGRTSDFYVVPAGKMLVIETLAVDAQLPGGESLTLAQAKLNGGGAVFPIPFTRQGGVFFAGVSTGKYYCTEGQSLLWSVARSAAGSECEINMMLSGYLVPVPVAVP